MTAADNMIPVLCTLARHHGGDHDEHGVPAKRPCGEVVRYVEREAEEVVPPVDVGPSDWLYGAAQLEHNHAIEGIFPLTCPACSLLVVKATPEEPLPPPTPPDPGPTCADRCGPVEAWIGDPPPNWTPGMRPPCIACGAESGKDCAGTPPAPVPAVPAETPEEYVQRVAERATEDAMKMMVTAEPPALADLIAEAVFRAERVEEIAKEAEAAQKSVERARLTLSVVHSEVAKRAGKGALVDIGGRLFRSVAPRKKGGGDGEGLWRLDPVEVKR